MGRRSGAILLLGGQFENNAATPLGTPSESARFNPARSCYQHVTNRSDKTINRRRQQTIRPCSMCSGCSNETRPTHRLSRAWKRAKSKTIIIIITIIITVRAPPPTEKRRTTEARPRLVEPPSVRAPAGHGATGARRRLGRGGTAAAPRCAAAATASQPNHSLLGLEGLWPLPRATVHWHSLKWRHSLKWSH